MIGRGGVVKVPQPVFVHEAVEAFGGDHQGLGDRNGQVRKPSVQRSVLPELMGEKGQPPGFSSQ